MTSAWFSDASAAAADSLARYTQNAYLQGGRYGGGTCGGWGGAGVEEGERGADQAAGGAAFPPPRAPPWPFINYRVVLTI